MKMTYPLSDELAKLRDEIRSYAVGYGLDFFEVIFEVCDYETINILAAQGGFPVRYPHWRFGMEYDQLAKNYRYGLQKIYEMVINNDPSYAYLLKANHFVDQKIVMAHVYGHSDFFKCNAWFSATDRNMINTMGNHGAKIRRYMERFGQEQVEVFIDKVHSLENLLDPSLLFHPQSYQSPESFTGPQENDPGLGPGSSALKSFMRSRERKQKKEQQDLASAVAAPLKTPAQPERDIMGFLSEHAPLADWQSDILALLREEAYYFLPQRMTKIMNEGWASYWHSKILTEKALNASEIIDFCDHHAGVVAMGQGRINPYKIGIELFRDIEERWDTGRFGKEYEECNDLREKAHWNQETRQGRAKIFEIRRTHNDITFIDEFLTPEFCERHKFFTYGHNKQKGRAEIKSREFLQIKAKLLSQLTNFGSPVIEILDSNYQNRGELLIRHQFQGVELDQNMARATLQNIQSLWSRPVNMELIVNKKEQLVRFDGQDFS